MVSITNNESESELLVTPFSYQVVQLASPYRQLFQLSDYLIPLKKELL